MATTSTVASSQSSSGDVPWGWIIGGLAVLALAVVLVIVMASKKRSAIFESWRQSTLPLLAEVRLTGSMVVDGASSASADHRADVQAEVDRTVSALATAAVSAPEGEPKTATNALREALLGLAFAVEASRLVHDPRHSPTATELRDAAEAVTTRQRGFDSAFTRLETLVTPPAPDVGVGEAQVPPQA
jgi:hypothetical protein